MINEWEILNEIYPTKTSKIVIKRKKVLGGCLTNTQIIIKKEDGLEEITSDVSVLIKSGIYKYDELV